MRPSGDSRGISMLTFTSLYPSEARPRHGIFVEARLAAIQRVAAVEAHVIAPVPWFPLSHRVSDEYARCAATAAKEVRLGNCVLHPRYLTLPGVGMYVQPLSMALGASRALRWLRKRDVEFDVIDAHYLYPDGVAAAILARRTRKPLVMTARGSDVNLLPGFAWPRRQILWAAREAHAIIAVSAALSNRLCELGVDPRKITVVRNGVDLDRFTPVDAREARARLGLPGGHLLVSVGNLVPEKAHDILIDALASVAEAHLLIVGDGPERSRLANQIISRGLSARVTLLAAQPQAELKWIYGAASVVLLASSREGLPNVLLEALACGTPVVAASVGGVPEIVTDPVAGRLVDQRTPEAFARAIAGLLVAPPSRIATRRFAQRFDWNAAARTHIAVLEQAAADKRARIGS